MKDILILKLPLHTSIHCFLDFIDSVAGSYRAGCACIVRIQLNNGNFHETVGYSCAEGSSKGSAIQKSRFVSAHVANQFFKLLGKSYIG